MQCPLFVGIAICNSFNVLRITPLLFPKDALGFLSSINNQWWHKFNVIPIDGTRVDILPYIQNTMVTVYSWIRIQTQERAQRGVCIPVVSFASPTIDFKMN